MENNQSLNKKKESQMILNNRKEKKAEIFFKCLLLNGEMDHLAVPSLAAAADEDGLSSSQASIQVTIASANLVK